MWLSVFVLLLGVTLVPAVGFYLHHLTETQSRQVFDERVSLLKDQLHNRHHRLVETLRTLGLLLQHSRAQPQAVFEQYVSSLDLPSAHPGLHSLLYIGASANAASAIEQVVSHAKPSKAAPSWSDHDLLANARLQSVLAAAHEQGSDQLSLPLAPDAPNLPQNLLALAYPVYGTASAAGIARSVPHRQQGWVVALIDPGALFASLEQSTHGELEFEVLLGNTPLAPSRPPSKLLRHTEALTLSGQPVQLLISSHPRLDPNHTLATAATGILAAGLLFSLFTALILCRTLLGRQRTVRENSALSAQLEVMATVARATRNGVLITDRNAHILWVNEGFSRLSGYSAQEALGRRPVDLLASNNTSLEDRQRIDAAVSKRENIEIEIVNRHKNGHDYWLRLEIRPYFDHYGEFQGFIQVQTDIHDEHQHNELMRGTLNEIDALMRALDEYALVSETDGNGNITRINKQFEDFSGYVENELIGKHFSVLNADSQASVFWNTIWKEVCQAGPWRGELLEHRKDGAPVWLDLILIPVRQSDGQVGKVIAIGLDITLRKKNESMARDNHEFFTQMGEVAGVGYWVFQTDDNKVELSEQTLKIMEADPADPPSLAEIYAHYTPESEFVLHMAIQQTSQLGEPFDLELQFTTFRNQQKWLRLAAKPEMRDGRLWRLIGAIQDITERVEAQRRIIENDRILRSAIDAIGEAFVLYDPDDRLVFCNEQYRALFDLSSDVIVPGARVEDIIRVGAERGQYPDAVGRVEEWVQERLEIYRSNAISQELRLNGNRWVRLAECRTQDGYHVGFRIDITDFKHAVEQAEEASRSKSRFLANMSHEIRTPMNAILGMLQLLKNTSLTANQADYVTKTQGAAKSLLGILNDILDFSKVEAGKLQLDPEPCVFDDMMRELSVIMSSNLGQKKLELLFDIDPELPPVLVFDALRLKQVLINLAGNAIKFTAQGEVLVRVNLIEKLPHQVRLHFAIKDSGIGISPENQKRIFEGFSQAEASTSRRFGGTGLGLAISSRLVALMGGELQLDSSPGVGSTFHFEIAMPVSESDHASSGWQSPLTHSTVLLVTANPLARTLHARQLRSFGCYVDSADNPAHASEIAKTRQARGHHYDAWVLDAQVERDGGAALSQALQAMSPAARTVIISTHDPQHLAGSVDGSAPWWDAWLIKPFTPGMLEHALHPGSGATYAQATVPAPLSGNELQGLRLLLVEDNPINQQVARELLQGHGAQVSVAANGQESLDLLNQQNHGIDAVLMDMQMPVMDGLQATQAIRQRLGLTELPIIAMTANAMPADKELCLSVGMNDHVGKPFDLAQLIQVLLYWTRSLPAGERSHDTQGHRLPPPVIQAARAHAAAPEFDPESAIARLGGDQMFFRKLLERFLDDMPDLIQQVLDQWELDFKEAAAASHTLKGSAATLGATRLAETSAQMEAHCKTAASAAPDAADWPASMVEKLQNTAAQAESAMRQWLAQTSTSNNTAPASSLNPQVLLAELQRLHQLLCTSDMESLEIFDQISHQAGINDLPHWNALSQAMEIFDFEEASRVIGNILEELPQ